MSEKLKPCPFCGGEASIKIHDYFDDTRLYTPKCKCGAGIVEVFYTEEEAIAAWNTRYERTCQMAYYEPCSGDEYYPTECYTCSECNNTVFTGKPRFCPNCGARVLSEEEQGHMVADAIRRLEKAVER